MEDNKHFYTFLVLIVVFWINSLIRQAYIEISLLYLDSASQRLRVINELQQAEREEPKTPANLPSPEKKKKSRVCLEILLTFLLSMMKLGVKIPLLTINTLYPVRVKIEL